MKYFHGEFCSFLNSEDLHDSELPLRTNKAKGGTLVLWRRELEPFITTHTCDTSSFLLIILEIPGYRTSIHIAVYLPTAGQDSQYMEDLAKLGNTIDEMHQKYPNPVIFIRGDANSSSKNNHRKTLFENFCRDNSLTRLFINHPTYHHFLGEGKFE